MPVVDISGDALWQEIEERCGRCIDKSLKAILKYTDLDNLVDLSKLTDEEKKFITTSMRTDIHFVISNEERAALYGLYKDKPDLFKFTVGQDMKLNHIVSECRSLLKSLLRREAQPVPSNIQNKVSQSSSPKTPQNVRIEVESTDQKIHGLTMQLELNINRWIVNNVPELVSEEENFSVTVRVTANGFGSYIAKVSCPEKDCNHVGNISMNRHRNWAVSNFYKHLKCHMKSDHQSIKDFFSPANGLQASGCTNGNNMVATPKSVRGAKQRGRLVNMNEEDEAREDSPEEQDFLSKGKQMQ